MGEFKVGVLDKVFRVRPAPGMNSVAQKTFGVSVSQTIKKGDAVKIGTATGVTTLVTQAIAIGSTPFEVTESGGNLGIVGFAAHDVSTDAGGLDPNTGKAATLAVYLAKGNEFLLRTVDSAHDVDKDGSYAEVQDTSVGTSYTLGRFVNASVADWWYVGTVTTTNGELRLTERYPDQALGDDYGLNWYRVIQSDTVAQI